MPSSFDIPNFSEGSFGKLSFAHLNQITDALRAMSSQIDQLMNENVMLSHKANETAYMTGNVPLMVRLKADRVEYGPPGAGYWGYDWEEVRFESDTGRWEHVQNVGYRTGSKDTSPALDLCQSVVPLTDEIGTVVRVRNFIDSGTGSTDMPYVYVFRPCTVGVGARRGVVEDPSGGLGAPYLMVDVVTGEEFEAINTIETSLGGRLGSEINSEDCENNPSWQPIRLQTGTELVCHYVPEEDAERRFGRYASPRMATPDGQQTLGDDEGGGKEAEEYWYFHIPNPIEAECGCTDDGLLRNESAGKINVEGLMLGGNR